MNFIAGIFNKPQLSFVGITVAFFSLSHFYLEKCDPVLYWITSNYWEKKKEIKYDTLRKLNQSN